MQDSKISWTDHTFNPWIGCHKVSPGCKHCYAERQVERFGGSFVNTRKTSAAYWRTPLRWQLDTPREWDGSHFVPRRPRVFCGSLCDVFMDDDLANVTRPQLWELIRQTQALDWLLLTKRPENIARMLPEGWGDGWPNVWLGTSIENQNYARERIADLLKIRAKVRFLSAEPLLGPIDLLAAVPCGYYCDESVGHVDHSLSGIHWVIVGGESGPGFRPMQHDWARSLRDQCEAAGVAYFFKQSSGRHSETGVELDGRIEHHWPDPRLALLQ